MTDVRFIWRQTRQEVNRFVDWLMGKEVQILLIVLLTVFMLEFKAFSYSASSEVAVGSGSGSDQWEYYRTAITPPAQTEEDRLRQLNELGKSGWELVAISNEPSSSPILYFKRRLR